MKNWQKILVIGIIGALCVWLLTGCGGVKGVQDVTGSFETSGGTTQFRAQITIETIQIWMTGDGSEALYWQGTVPNGGNIDAGSEFTSTADKSALDGSLFGSGSDTKAFKVHTSDELTFDFGIMGATSEIVLKRS